MAEMEIDSADSSMKTKMAILEARQSVNSLFQIFAESLETSSKNIPRQTPPENPVDSTSSLAEMKQSEPIPSDTLDQAVEKLRKYVENAVKMKQENNLEIMKRDANKDSNKIELLIEKRKALKEQVKEKNVELKAVIDNLRLIHRDILIISRQ